MLQKFGFSQYESKVYEVLATSKEPMDATMIVKYSGVPKSKIYEVLSRLIEKGMLLDSISEKKKLYTALPSDLAIQKLTAEFQSHIQELREKTTEKPFTDDRVWSLKKDSSIRAQSKQLIHEAASSILISAWNDDYLEYLPLLEEKERSGIKVEAFSVGQLNSSLRHIQTLLPEEESKLERYRLIITDHREVIFAGVENDSWQAMKTTAQPFVKFFTEFFYHDVALSKITDKYKDLLLGDPEIKDTLIRLRY